MGEWTREPWRNMNGFGIICGNYDAAIHREPMVCRSPDQFSINDNNFNRIVACVNAMQGIPDPEKFVEAAKRLRNGFKLAIGLLEMDANKNELIAEFDQALAAKPEEAK